MSQLDAVDRRRHRALNRAARALPAPAVVRAVSANISGQCEGTKAAAALPSLLSKVLGMPPPLTFRQNTTQAIRDLIQVMLLHHLDSSHAAVAAPGRLLCTDVQHPAIHEALRTAWAHGPRSGVVLVPLADMLVNTREDDPEVLGQAVLQRYLSAMHRDRVSVVVLPHVVWFNGAVLDVVRICRALRAAEPEVVLIVDGAQAVGHIEVPAALFQPEVVDFYVGCGHKWLGGPETLGFARVADRVLKRCRRCAELLASGDVLGEVGGLSERYRARQFGTHPMGVAHGTMKALELLTAREGGFHQVVRDIHVRAMQIRTGVEQLDAVRLLGPPVSSASAVVAFSAPVLRLHDARVALGRRGYTPACYRLSESPAHPAVEFLRLSPGPDLSRDEVDEVVAILGASFQGRIAG